MLLLQCAASSAVIRTVGAHCSSDGWCFERYSSRIAGIVLLIVVELHTSALLSVQVVMHHLRTKPLTAAHVHVPSLLRPLQL
jgi:hypothetical protein